MYTQLIGDKAQKLILIQELNVAIKKEQIGLRGFLIIGDDVALQDLSKAHDEYLRLSKGLADIIAFPKAKDLLKELNQIENEYYQICSQGSSTEAAKQNG